MQVDYHKMTRDFLLGESKEAGITEYLSVIAEMLEHLREKFPNIQFTSK